MRDHDEQKESFIDFLIGTRTQPEEFQTENLPTIDSRSSFLENSKSGLWTKETIKSVYKTFDRGELECMQRLLDAFGEKVKITTSVYPKIDRNGLKYYWIQEYRKNGIMEYKVRYFEGLDNLLSTYLDGHTSLEIFFEILFHESLV